MNTREHLADWATMLAAMGWPVFPMHPRSKVAAVKNWEARATTEPSRIARCWAAGEWNIGLATGPAGLVVVDLDVPKPGEVAPDGWNMLGISSGVDVLATLAERAGGEIPETWEVATPSGGTHLYYRAPKDQRFRNTTGSAGGLGWLVDTRAWGGCVVAPGSVSNAGTGGYELVDDRPPVDLPGWLVQALAPKPAAAVSGRPQTPAVDVGSYLRSALDMERLRVWKAPAHQHNRSLFIAACALGQLVAGGSLAEHTARDALLSAMQVHINSSCNCTEREALTTIASGFRYGARKPRRLPPTGQRPRAA